MPAAPTLLAGRYRLGESLGRGGMGQVWLARDEILDRDVAVKEIALPDELRAGDRDVAQRRTLREARAAARLNHPHVVQVYDVLEIDGRTWIVMEHVASRSLQEVIAADGPLAEDRVAGIGLDLLAALEAAHRAGVWHRDVKPANVLLGHDGRVVLSDFGIATIEGDGLVTGTGLVVGSPEYMPPERARHGTAGPAADLWSLGATLYAAVEGRSPYHRGSVIATLTALAADEPDPPRRARVLRPVLDGLLRTDPAKRTDIAETRRRLRAVVSSASAVSPASAPAAAPSGSAPQVPGQRQPDPPASPPPPSSPPPSSPPASSPPASSPPAPRTPPAAVAAAPSAPRTPPAKPVAAGAAPAPDTASEPGPADNASAASEPSAAEKAPPTTPEQPAVSKLAAVSKSAVVSRPVAVPQPTVAPDTTAPSDQAPPTEPSTSVEPAAATEPPTTVEPPTVAAEPAAATASSGPEAPTEPSRPAGRTDSAPTERTEPAPPTTPTEAPIEPSAAAAVAAPTRTEPARDPAPPTRLPPPRKRRRRVLVAAVAVLVALVLAGAGWYALRPDPDTAAQPTPTRTATGAAAPATPSTGATAGATADAAPPPGTVPSGSPAGSAAPAEPTAPAGQGNGGGTEVRPTLPAGWREHRDRTGFSVYVPSGWRQSREGSIVYFRSPRGGRVLGIDQTDRPKADPVADWRGQAAYRVRRGDFPGYDQIHIRSVRYWQKAADWEFTFDGGNRRHVNNRGFVVSKNQAYGIYWQTSDADWDEARDDLQLVFDSFRPARD